MIITNILLGLITLILWLDFFIKNSILIKKKFRRIENKITKKPDLFYVKHKWHWEKIIDELEKTLD